MKLLRTVFSLNTLALLAVLALSFIVMQLYQSATVADKADRRLHEELLYSTVGNKVSDLQRLLGPGDDTKVDTVTLDETWRVCSSVKRVSPNSKDEF